MRNESLVKEQHVSAKSKSICCFLSHNCSFVCTFFNPTLICDFQTYALILYGAIISAQKSSGASVNRTHSGPAAERREICLLNQIYTDNNVSSTSLTGILPGPLFVSGEFPGSGK